MGVLIERLLNQYEAGGLTRRQLVQGLAGLGLGAASGVTRAQPTPSTFGAVGLNHIALNVTDIPRAREFYVRHLGVEVTSASAGTCVLRCGESILRGPVPRRQARTEPLLLLDPRLHRGESCRSSSRCRHRAQDLRAAYLLRRCRRPRGAARRPLTTTCERLL